MVAVSFFKVEALPEVPVADAFYYVLSGGLAESYLTTSFGEPVALTNSEAVAALVESIVGPALEQKIDKQAGFGLYPEEDSDKLAGIADGATLNATDAQLRDRSTHTGVQAISTITDLQSSLNSKVAAVAGSSLYPDADRAKLAGISAGATANQTNSYLLDRANHTGSQAQSTVTGLPASLAALSARMVTVSMTQAAYDALPSKDANTLYVIVG